MRKLFVSDLDGTLLNGDKEIDSHSVDVIKKIKNAGHIFCIATGRSWEEAERYYKLLELDTPCIIFNGGKMVCPSNKNFVPNTYSINNEIFYKLWKNNELQKEIDYFVIKTAKGNYTSKIPTSKDLIRQFYNLFHINITNVKDIKKEVLIRTTNRHTDALSIILVLKDPSSLVNVVREIKSVVNNISINKWVISDKKMGHSIKSRLIIELNNRSANKLKAVQTIQDYYDIDDNDVYVFGDGENDVCMLKAFNNSIAVSNAEYSPIINAHHISRYSANDGAVGKEIENILSWKK